jgi:MFS family permease
MYCSSSFEIGFFGTCFFIGMMVASFTMPPLSEIYGRKFIINMANIAQFSGFLLFVLVQNVNLYYFLMFVMGTSYNIKLNIGYNYMMEFFPGRESKYTGIMFFMQGVVIIMVPGSLYFLSRDMDTILIVSIFINLISFLVFIFVPWPESI